MTFSIKLCRFGNHLFPVCLWPAVCFTCLLVLSTGAGAADLPIQDTVDTGNTFYDKAKQGWFWYEDPPPDQEEQETRPEKPKPPRKVPSLDAYSIDDLWNMHPDDFQGLLNDLQKKAVQAPTEDNILQYLMIQDVARRKALAYTSATMYVTQKYSDLLNANHVYPTAGPGITARVQMQEEEISRTIGQAERDHALLFFVSPSCGFCEKQAQILAYFVEKYGWQVKMVDIAKQANAAARFNVTITPTLLLIKKGQEQYMTVATGVIALSELERKLYRALRYLQGNTNGDNFLMYDFQKGSTLDPLSILNKGRQPWTKTH